MACDLLKMMITFNPNKRADVEECLAHPYLESLHDPEKEQGAPQPFDWSIDDFEPTAEILRKLIYKEALKMQIKGNK